MTANTSETCADSWWTDRRAWPLAVLGAVMLASGIAHLPVWAVLGGPWEGPVTWRKPILFGISGGLTAISLGWVWSMLPMRRADVPLAEATAWALFVEVFLIDLQRWRGVGSHFNRDTPLDSFLFDAMGILIVAVTLVIADLALRLLLRRPAVTADMLLAARAGMLLLLVSCLLGIWVGMHGETQLDQGLDPTRLGAAGVPKFPHGVVIHAVQWLPALAWAMRRTGLAEALRWKFVAMASGGSTLLLVYAVAQTALGRARFDLVPATTVVLVAALAGLAVPIVATSCVWLYGLRRRRHLRWRGIAALASLVWNFRWARVRSEAADPLKRDALLNDQQSQLHSLVANSSAVISLKDLQGRFMLVNDRYTKPYPGMQGRWAGTTAERWFPPTVAASIAESDAHVVAFGQPMTFEEVVPHDDGPHAYVTIKFPVKDAAGTMVGVGSISTDVTELKEAQVAIKQKEQMLRKLIEVQESEKQAICHDIHDGMLQYVIAAKMLLHSYVEQQPKPADSSITEAIDCLAKSIEDARQVVRGVRSAVLDDLGLPAAIDDLCDQFTVSGCGVTTSLAADLGDVPLVLQTTAFRIVQEALTNARKHSTAASVAIEVTRSDDGLQLTVRDDGCGFDTASVRSQGFGLMGMRERVRLAGGEIRIDSSPGRGTTITARLPVPKGEPIATPAAGRRLGP